MLRADPGGENDGIPIGRKGRLPRPRVFAGQVDVPYGAVHGVIHSGAGEQAGKLFRAVFKFAPAAAVQHQFDVSGALLRQAIHGLPDFAADQAEGGVINLHAIPSLLGNNY